MSLPILPDSEDQAASVIADCAARGEPVSIAGGNTKAGLGHAVQAEKMVSIRNHAGIVSYNPAEMVLSAKAGTTMAEIDAALTGKGQMLAFEPPDYRGIFASSGESTIGGLFACNMSGPRRFVAGAARDSLLGVRFVNGLGQVIKSGGRVMKNVTGLDVVKLMAGSFGTLGLLTEVTMKVLPRPAVETTLILPGPDDEQAAAIMAAMMATSLEISGAAYLPESCKNRFLADRLPDGGQVALRLEGLAFSVAERADRLTGLLAGHGSIIRLDADESRLLWSEIRDVKPFQGSAKPLWKVSVAPMAGAHILNALRMQTGVDGFFDWQGGLLWLQMEAGCEADLVRSLVARHGGGHATLVRASDTERAEVAVFEPRPAPLAALEARIRTSLDPSGIFNPGRMG